LGDLGALIERSRLEPAIMYEDEVNVETVAAQAVQANGQDLRIEYRTANTIGSGGRNAIRFDMQDSTNARVTGAGYLLFEIQDNVAASYDTQLEVWCKVAGSATEVLDVDGLNGGMLRCGGANRRVGFKETGLTGQRIYTFPDADALIAGQNFANAFSAANTFSGIATFSVAPVINNNIALNMKDSGGTSQQVAKVDASNNLIFGAGANWATMQFFSGNASAAMAINSSNVLTTSPVWGTVWIQNNNLGIQMKDSGGTARTLVYMSGGNLFSIGDLASNGYNTSIWAGQASAALSFTNTNQATFTKMAQAGLGEVIAKFVVSDDAVGHISLENVAATNAVFSGALRAKAGTNATSFFILAESTVANDTSTAPLLIIDSRHDDNTAITTRPLVAFRNSSGAVYLQFNASNQVEISPAWATNLVLNNSIALQGKDSGGTARNMLRHVNDDVYLSNFTAAGNLYFRMIGANDVLSINKDGLFTFTRTATASAAETVAEFRVSDSAATSYFRIANFSATDAIFAPRLLLNNGDSADPIELLTQIGPTLDTGANAVLDLTIRRNDNTVITTRPVFRINNRGNSLYTINPTGFQHVFQALSATTTAESIAKFLVSDETNGWVAIDNQLTSDGDFIPRLTLRGDAGTSATAQQLIVEGSAAGDLTGTNPYFSIQFRNHDATSSILNRPLMTWTNFTDAGFFRVNAKLDVLHIITAQTGVAETLYEFRTSDVSSYLRFFNGSATDARFAATIRGRQIEDATIYALRLEGAVEPAHDTGTAPIMIFMSQQQGGIDVTTRPLYDFRNNSTSVFKINAKGDILQSVISQASTAEVLAKYVISDDASSYMQFDNNSSADATYAPRIIFNYGKADALQAGGYQMFIIPTAQDSGTVPAAIFESRLASAANVATRPLFDFRNVATSVMKINSNGDQVVTAIARTGITENIMDLKVSDNAGFIRLTNNTNTDGSFGGQLDVTLATGSAASTVAMIYVHRILAANDSGSNPVVQMQMKSTTFTDITTKPLLDIVNNASTVFSMKANGDVLHNVKSQTGVAELIGSWQVSDNATAYFQIANAVSTDGVFVPRIKTYNFGAGAANNAFLITNYINTTEDSGSAPISIFDVRLSNDTSVLTRTVLWRFRNAGTTLIDVNQYGRVTLAHQDEGIEETILNCTMSDGGASYMRIDNAVGGVASSFVPRLWGSNDLANATYSGLFIYGSILAGQDTGTVPAVAIDGRIGSATALAVRPMFGIRNSSTLEYLFYADRADFLNNRLDKVWGVQQGAYATRVTHWMYTPTTNGQGTGVYNTGSTFTGTISSSNDNGGGFCRITAASGIDALAAMDTILSITTRGSLPKWQANAVLDSVTDVRFKCGLCTANFTTGAVTISAGNAGAAFRFIYGTDTNFMFVTNDANGTTADTNIIDTGLAPAASTQYEFEIYWDGTNFNWAIYNASGTTLASGSTNTAIPGASHVLLQRIRTENTTSTAKSWFWRWINISKSGQAPALPYN